MHTSSTAQRIQWDPVQEQDREEELDNQPKKIEKMEQQHNDRVDRNAHQNGNDRENRKAKDNGSTKEDDAASGGNNNTNAGDDDNDGGCDGDNSHYRQLGNPGVARLDVI